MTDRQEHLLRIANDLVDAPGRLYKPDREAIRTALADRAAYHQWAEAWLARYFESGYSQQMIMEAMAELRAIYARATGGTS